MASARNAKGGSKLGTVAATAVTANHEVNIHDIGNFIDIIEEWRNNSKITNEQFIAKLIDASSPASEQKEHEAAGNAKATAFNDTLAELLNLAGGKETALGKFIIQAAIQDRTVSKVRAETEKREIERRRNEKKENKN